MSPEVNPFDQPISSLGNLTQAKELKKNEKVQSKLDQKNIEDFKEEIAWQKQLESEDPEFMKDVKLSLLPKLEEVINHLQEIVNNPASSSKAKFDAQGELDRRITQQNRILEKYKNND